MNIKELRSMVLSTVKEIQLNERRSRRLRKIMEKANKHILSEEVYEKEDELKQVLDLPYPEFVKELQAKKADLLKTIRGGLEDGSEDDDKFTVTGETLTLKQLTPCQNEIDFYKSVTWYFKQSGGPPKSKQGPKNVPKLLDGGPMQPADFAGNPIITCNKAFIVDGHHRWSGMFAINPDCKVDVFNIEFPNLSGEEAAEMALKVAQLWIVSNNQQPDISKGKKAGPVNVLESDEGTFKKELEKVVEIAESAGDMEEVRAAYSVPGGVKRGFPEEGSDEDKNTWIINDIASNLAQMNSDNAHAAFASDNNRGIMPQVADFTGAPGPSRMKKDAKSGEVNYVPSTTSESRENNSKNVVLERWSKLAGILKD